MPNLISVTSSGTPQDLLNGYSALQEAKTGLVDYAPEPVKRFAGDALAAARDLKAVASANPLAYIVNDLVFPEAVADGTLKGKPGFE